MNRTEIINSLIKKNNYSNYLEIGVQNGYNFSKIEIENKVGVDPDPNSKATIHLTSGEFFKQNKEKFDIIFVDGLHIADTVLEDINNSLNVLNEGGTIICHDMLPISEATQRVPRETKMWFGDCWKAFVELRSNRDLEMRTIDTDCGCGIIKRGKQLPINPIKIKDLVYNDFVTFKYTYMNIISVEDFKKIYL